MANISKMSRKWQGFQSFWRLISPKVLRMFLSCISWIALTVLSRCLTIRSMNPYALWASIPHNLSRPFHISLTIIICYRFICAGRRSLVWVREQTTSVCGRPWKFASFVVSVVGTAALGWHGQTSILDDRRRKCDIRNIRNLHRYINWHSLCLFLALSVVHL